MSTVSLPRRHSTGRTDVALDAAYADVKAEMARTDNKASLLLAFDGAVLAGLWTVATGLPLPAPALVATGVGAVVLLAAVAVLLTAVRPRLGGTDHCSFPYWATLEPGELRRQIGRDRRPESIVTLSRIAVAKFGRLQRAVDLTRTAGALLALAAVIAVVVRLVGGAW